MASVLGEAFIEISAPLTRLGRDLSRAQGMVDRSAGVMGSRFGRLGAAMSSIGTKMTLGVTLPIIGYMAVAVKAASDAEKASSALNAALRLQKAYTRDTSAELSKYAEETMKLTVFDDELVKSTMAFGMNLGISSDKIQEATTAAIGLSYRIGKDLPTAMMLMARAFKGRTEMFTRYGIVLDENMTKEQKLATVMKMGAESFPLATAHAATNEGQMLQLANAVGELNESIGEGLIPNLKSLVRSMKTLADFVEDMPRGWRAWGIGALAALGPVVLIIGQITQAMILLRTKALLAKLAVQGVGAAGGVGVAAGGMAGTASKLLVTTLQVTGALIIGGAIGKAAGEYGMKRAQEGKDPGWVPLAWPGWAIEHIGNAAIANMPRGPALPMPQGYVPGQIRTEESVRSGAITKDQGEKIIKELQDIKKKTGTWG
jgi:hypothetical protein